MRVLVRTYSNCNTDITSFKKNKKIKQNNNKIKQLLIFPSPPFHVILILHSSQRVPDSLT